MKGKFYIIAIIASVLTSFLFFAGLACENDDDDSSSNNDDDTDTDDDVDSDDDSNTPYDPECDDTNQPLLLAVHLYVNDVEVSMPATVLTTDTLKVGMEYSDVDCNMDNGRINIQISQQEPDVFELDKAIPQIYIKITDEIGCSSEEAGTQYFVELDPAHFIVPAELTRTLPFHFHLHDGCDYRSVPTYLPLDFTVIEG